MIQVKVYLNAYQKRQFVGILEQRDQLLFEYAPEFLKTGIELSPFMLPLKSGVFVDRERTFDGLFGLFNDSLPDGWGCLLLDRYLQKQGLSYYAITPLHRLSLIANHAMGALEYEPTQSNEDKWADPINEFMCAYAVGQYYEDCGKDGLICPDRLPISGERFAGGNVAYHIRPGQHYISRTDWNYYMDYIKNHMEK